MTFIRERVKTKKGKKYHYFYYCIRRRSRIKDGGDGKILCPDRLIGDHPINGKYLAFHLWDGLSAVDYAEALITFQLKGYSDLCRYLKWWIEWKFRKGKPTAGKLKFRAIEVNGITTDARASYPRNLRIYLQCWLDALIKFQDAMNDDIEAIAARLARYERLIKLKEATQANYREWKADPYREWEEDGQHWKYHKDYGDQCLDNIEKCQHYADVNIQAYQDGIADLLNDCPPGERERFKAAIVRRFEKLAADPTFLDRHDCK